MYLRLKNPRGSKYKGNQKHILVSLTRVAKLVRFLCLLAETSFSRRGSMSQSARRSGDFIFSLFQYLVFIETSTENPASYR